MTPQPDLAADGVDGLGDVFRAARRRALEEHVLDEMSNAALFLRFVSGAARQPDPDADGAHVGHPLREESKTIRKHVADDGRL